MSETRHATTGASVDHGMPRADSNGGHGSDATPRAGISSSGTWLRWGVVGLMMAVAAGTASTGKAEAASFDCGAAKAADEIAICRSQALSDLDVRMTTTYGILVRLVAMGQRGNLQDGQRAFLASRAACGADIACIAAAYRDRLSVLDKAVDAIVSRGPY